MKKHSITLSLLLFLTTALSAQNLRIVDDAGLVARFSQGNKPRIINFWATWCKPCMEEMPHFVKADSVYGDKIDFVFVAFDRVRDTARVMQKIAEYNIPGEHLLIKTAEMGNLIDAVDSTWGGALPVTWYASGQYRGSKQDSFEHFSDLKRFIETFLKLDE
ncbi:MAG: TlpA family protein disulfide reductase [Sphingomonadales bacterium]